MSTGLMPNLVTLEDIVEFQGHRVAPTTAVTGISIRLGEKTDPDQVRAIGCSGHFHDVSAVVLDCFARDAQLGGDLLARSAANQ